MKTEMFTECAPDLLNLDRRMLETPWPRTWSRKLVCIGTKGIPDDDRYTRLCLDGNTAFNF